MRPADFLAGVRCARRDVAETLRQLGTRIDAGTPIELADIMAITDRVLAKYEVLAESNPS
jgi:hypothetical protein